MLASSETIVGYKSLMLGARIFAPREPCVCLPVPVSDISFQCFVWFQG